jgi:hypothetical protein
LVAGSGATHRLVTAAITTIAYFVLGLVTSEVLFGWATEKELQPNVDGPLSRDEVLLSSVLVTAVVVILMRYVGRRTAGRRHGPGSGHD